MKTIDASDLIDTLQTTALAPREAEDAPSSGTRPVSEPSLDSIATTHRLAALPPVRAPKHTFDAISIADPPVASRRRGRATAAVVTVVAAIAIVAVGKHVVGKAEASPSAHAAAATTADPASTPPLAPAAALDGNAAPTPAADPPPAATSRHATAAPPKSKHAKPSPRKHAPPPHTQN